MSKRFGNLIKLLKEYPYNTMPGRMLILDYFLLRFFPKISFPKMSIVSFVKKAYNLDSDEEFRTRYYLSRVGAEALWNSRPRNDKNSIEHFYQEHDMDIWRQAQFSKYDYNYKKKMLRIYHILRSSISKSAPVLDFGCGSGVLFHYLRLNGFTAVDGADIPSRTLDFISNWLVSFARHIINLSSEQLPSNHYAAIVVVDCLEHTTEPVKITQNLMKSLRKGGILIIQFPRETDFSYTHARQAQEQRDAVFDLIKKSCQVVIPEFIFRKI